MQYKLSKDFGRFSKGDILLPCVDRENMYECTSGKHVLFLEHIDVILALPEIYVPMEETPKRIDDFISEVYELDNDCGKHFADIARKALMKHAPTRNIYIGIDPANGDDEGCAVISEHDGETMTILECIGLHKCKCQKVFTEEYIREFMKYCIWKDKVDAAIAFIKHVGMLDK